MKKICRFIRMLFGKTKVTWPRLIIFATIMGIYTALMAMLVPDGNSFHDIAVTPEWWVLPAILVIVNCKKPLEAALKTFVFFLISQPLVYLIQVPFNSMGWSLFIYYKYWFSVTLLTFPGAFIGWYIKKDKWYSGIILSVMTVLLVVIGANYAYGFIDYFPNHLLSTIYCFGIIPVFILAIFKDKKPRIITAAISVAALIVMLFYAYNSQPFETYRNTLLEDNDIVLVGEPTISSFSGTGKGNVEIIKNDESYTFKISGLMGKEYHFTVSDDKNEYSFTYYFDKANNIVTVKKE